MQLVGSCRLELRDRRGRRRHPSRPSSRSRRRSPGRRLHTRELSGALTFGIQTSGGAAAVPQVERETGPSHPARPAGHRPRPGTGRGQGGPLAQADLHRPGSLRGDHAAGGRSHRDASSSRVDCATKATTARSCGPWAPAPPIPRSTHYSGSKLPSSLGSVLAIAVAVALSPLAPLGPVRSVYRASGFSCDWTVLGFGVLVLLIVLSAVAGILAYTTAPHRLVLRPRLRSTAGARLVSFVARAGLRAPGVVGVRMALEPGEGRAAVPVRSALLGSIMAVTLVITTLTFGASLQTLVSNPPLYGWNWTYILNPVGSGGGKVPQVASTLLKHDKDVAAYSGADFNSLQVDGQEIPFLLEDRRGHRDPADPRGTRAPGGSRGGARRGQHVPTARPRRARGHHLLGNPRRCSCVHPADAPRGRRHGDLSRHRLRQHGLGPHLHGNGDAPRVPGAPQVLPGGDRRRARPGTDRAQSGARPNPAGRHPGRRARRDSTASLPRRIGPTRRDRVDPPATPSLCKVSSVPPRS